MGSSWAGRGGLEPEWDPIELLFEPNDPDPSPSSLPLSYPPLWLPMMDSAIPLSGWILNCVVSLGGVVMVVLYDMGAVVAENDDDDDAGGSNVSSPPPPTIGGVPASFELRMERMVVLEPLSIGDWVVEDCGT